jgi:MGT family glycosyltransferase
VVDPDPDLLVHAEAIARAAEIATPQLIAELRDGDVLLYDSMTLWGWQAARAWGGPAVCGTATFALHPAFFPLPSSELAEIYFHRGDDPTVVYTSRAFQPRPELFGRETTWVGAPAVAGAPPPLPERTHVYAALGTLYNDRPEAFRAIAAAFDEPVIMAVGDRVRLDGLPDHVTAHRWIPDQHDVLRGARLFVTHSGMNSVQEALSCGVPLLLHPQTDEQRAVAARVVELGAGRLLPEPTPAAIRHEALAVHNSDAAARAAAIGETLRAAPGAPAVADALEGAAAESTI